MNLKTAILAVLVLSVFLVGCSSGQTGYAAYNQHQGQQQPYVGGGCGVARNSAYGAPADDINSPDSAL